MASPMRRFLKNNNLPDIHDRPPPVPLIVVPEDEYEECDFCTKPAIYFDNVYCPVSVKCCEDAECSEQAAWELFNLIMENPGDDDD